MANHFGFQMSEDFLTNYANYVKHLRELNPGKSYVVKLSVELVPDGIGYEITSPPSITVEEEMVVGSEPLLQTCPYCGQAHQTEQIEQYPLKS